MALVDLAVIGAGPGGYVAAIRAAQLGLQVTLIEKEQQLGGTCLRIGCIPSKALLESSHIFELASKHSSSHGVRIEGVSLDLAAMHQRKEQVVAQLTEGVAGLMKKNKVQVLRGTGRLLAPGVVEVLTADGPQRVEAKSVLLATGSQAIPLPFAPFDGKRVVTSTEALSFDSVPAHLLVVGGGAVGLELGLVWHRLGAKVTVVEMLPRIAPFADGLMSRMLLRSLKAQGMEIRTATQVTGMKAVADGMQVSLADKKGAEEILCDRVLVSVGRKPYIEGLGLVEAGVTLTDRGLVAVDSKCQTQVASVYAIGDLVAGPALAHKAEEEGMAVAEGLAGLPGEVHHELIPAVVYTHPELAMVGKTEEQCKEEKLDFRSGKFYFRANGRAIAAEQTDGLVKILADAKTDRILGVHIVGPGASELIAEAVMAMEFGASAEDLARTTHAHPSFAEAVREAALAVDGRAIHA